MSGKSSLKNQRFLSGFMWGTPRHLWPWAKGPKYGDIPSSTLQRENRPSWMLCYSIASHIRKCPPPTMVCCVSIENPPHQPVRERFAQPLWKRECEIKSHWLLEKVESYKSSAKCCGLMAIGNGAGPSPTDTSPWFDLCTSLCFQGLLRYTCLQGESTAHLSMRVSWISQGLAFSLLFSSLLPLTIRYPSSHERLQIMIWNWTWLPFINLLFNYNHKKESKTKQILLLKQERQNL